VADAAAAIKLRHAQRLDQARAAQARGQIVVGYAGLDVPEELILAAGMVPLRLEADVLATTANVADFGAGGHPVLRSLVDRLLGGPYEFIDHLVVSTMPRNLAALTVLIRELHGNDARFARFAVHQLDLLHSDSASAGDYNLAGLRSLALQLEQWSGQRSDEARLHAAIALCNETRRLLQEFARLRAQGDHLDGVVALQLYACAQGAERESFNVQLRDWLRGDALRSRAERPRIVYSGTATGTTALYAAIEAQGLYIVDDDQDFGARGAGPQVDEHAEPLPALALAYAQRAPAAAGWPTQARRDYLLQQLERCRPDGVLFYNAAYDHPPAWDYPLLRAAVDAAGIPAAQLDPFSYRDISLISAGAADFAAALRSGHQEAAP
jgi:benzoyl-CoA reductase/2-hydroxyglutaryl-CoA dehydratase subunit BcrC/BadD/HgdB